MRDALANGEVRFSSPASRESVHSHLHQAPRRRRTSRCVRRAGAVVETPTHQSAATRDGRPIRFGRSDLPSAQPLSSHRRCDAEVNPGNSRNVGSARTARELFRRVPLPACRAVERAPAGAAQAKRRDLSQAPLAAQRARASHRDDSLPAGAKRACLRSALSGPVR